MEDFEVKEALSQPITEKENSDESKALAPERLTFRGGVKKNLEESEDVEKNLEESEDVEEAPRDEREDFIHPERLALRRKGEAKRLAIEAEFRKINALDPTVKSFDDLMLMENAEEFAEKVRKGYSLYDAFIITNGKKLSEKLKSSAVRSALTRLGAKQHLVSTSSGVLESAVDVPAETYSLYKTLYPDITDREIKKHYKKHNK